MADIEEARRVLLEKTSWHPSNLLEGMIQIDATAKLPALHPQVDPTGSLGNLDALPLELLHIIFTLLDLQTLTRFSRTCVKALAALQSLIPYRDLIHHVPQTLIALSQTCLLHNHSLHQLHLALSNHKCLSCHQLGPFLYLPSCERVCFNCTDANRSLWTIRRQTAEEILQLPRELVDRLPVLHSLPGDHYFGHETGRRELVSVRAARELAREHGRDVEAGRLAERRGEADWPGIPRNTAGCAAKRGRTEAGEWILRAPTRAPGRPLLSVRPWDGQTDPYAGMACVPMPFLGPGGRVETGTWCEGCHDFIAREVHLDRPETYGPFAHVVVITDWPDDEVLHELVFRARTEAEFWEHLAHCPGAPALVPDLMGKLRLVLGEIPEHPVKVAQYTKQDYEQWMEVWLAGD